MEIIVDAYHEGDADSAITGDKLPSDSPRGVVIDSPLAVAAAQAAMAEYRTNHAAFDADGPDDLDNPATKVVDDSSAETANSKESTLLPVGGYIYVDSDSNIRPLDPLTGDLLRPDMVPESLWHDDELRHGYEFLSQQCHRINFTLLLGAHIGENALDEAGIDLTSAVTELSIVGGTLIREGARTKMTRTAEQEENVERHKDQVASQLSSVGTPLLDVNMPEVDFDDQSPRPADQALAQWWRDVEAKQKFAVSALMEAPEEGFKAYDDVVAMIVGFEAYREWYLVGKIGAALADIDARQRPFQGLDVAALFGSLHVGLGRRLESMGVNVTYQGETVDSQTNEEAAFTRMIEEMVVPLNERVARQAALRRIRDNITDLEN